jgi:hypothetical protein
MNILNKTNTEKVTDLTTLLELEQLIMARQNEVNKKFLRIEGSYKLDGIFPNLEYAILEIIKNCKVSEIKSCIEMARQLIARQEIEVYKFGLETE